MSGRRKEMRRSLVQLALAQSGYFTAGQALELGYSYQTQKFHVDEGNWLRVDRGILRLPDVPPSEYDTLVRWYLWAKGKGVISHESALSAHRLGDANPALIHLSVPRDFQRAASGVRLHKGELPRGDDVVERQGFKLTTPLRTLLDVAAGNLETDQLATAIADGLDAGLITRRQLLTRVDSFGPHAALRVEHAFDMIKDDV